MKGHVESSFSFLFISKRFQGDWLHWRLQDRKSTICNPMARAKCPPTQHFALEEPKGNDLEDAGFAIHEIKSKVNCDPQISPHFVTLFTFLHVYVFFSQLDCKFLEDRFFCFFFMSMMF